jgi:hypothetical protein
LAIPYATAVLLGPFALLIFVFFSDLEIVFVNES